MYYFTAEMIYFIFSIIILFLLFFLSKKNNTFKTIFIVSSIIVNICYLSWRILFTLPHDNILGLIFGIILIIAELMGFFQMVVFKLLFIKPYSIKPRSISEFETLPTIDIFIATYNESESLLKKTIAAALNICYPKELKNIYLCDDGQRETLKKLCVDFEINYLSRTNNNDAKAGNINNALEKSSGEFFIIFDADMIAKENFLIKTLPYFLEEKTSFVQTPQVFYNPDPFQYNLHFNTNIPNEQDFFMRDIQQGRSRYNATLHVGTNAVFRRSSIDEIGGIPTGTITEDMATGMLLQSKGYKGIFINEVLALGLSVEKFSDLIKQRERWCRGNIQVSKKWNPLTLPGLSFFQRLIYLDGLIYWFFGVQKLIYIICPLIYLIFGITILNANAFDLFLFFMPSYIASFLSFRALIKQNRTLTWSHIYEVAMAPFLAIASLTELIFSRSIPFKVTPKGSQENKIIFSWNIAIPQIILLFATLLGFALSWTSSILSDNVVNSLIINIIWAVYNLIGILLSILVCFERPRFRSSERFAMNDELVIELDKVHKASCSLEDISTDGLSMVCKKEEIKVNNSDNELELLIDGLTRPLKGKVAWVKENDNKAGISFSTVDPELYKKLIQYLFSNYEGYYNKKP